MIQAVKFGPGVSWHHADIERVDTPDAGASLFARAPLAKGEILVTWGGVIVTSAALAALPEFAQHRTVQVEDDLYLTSGMIDDDADCVNHSCNPTAALSGQITLIAFRDITPGEEINFDYAMTDAGAHMDMNCLCGQPDCRHRITGSDWQRPELQTRFKGHFSPYIQRKIDRWNAR